MGAGMSLWPNATRMLNTLGVLDQLSYRRTGHALQSFAAQRPDDFHDLHGRIRYARQLTDALSWLRISSLFLIRRPTILTLRFGLSFQWGAPSETDSTVVVLPMPPFKRESLRP